MLTELSVHGDSPPPLEGKVRTSRNRTTRPLVSYIPVATAVVGVTIVLASVVFFYAESDVRRLVSVTLGLSILIVSVWFAANPFRRGVRRYRFLRREISDFINLAQLLHRQVVADAEPGSVERIKAKMHSAVDRMALEADKTS